MAASAVSRVRKMLSAVGQVEPFEPMHLLIAHPAEGTSASDWARVLAEVEQHASVVYVTPVLQDRKTGGRQILTDEITVRLRAGAPARRVLGEMARAEDLSVARRNEFVPTQYTLKVARASGMRTLDVARRLEQRDDVEFAAPNYVVDAKR